MTEPTQAGRALRLNAIRDRSDTAQGTILSHLCDAVIDRRWLLGEVDRLRRDLDNANERLTVVVADYERDTQ